MGERQPRVVRLAIVSVAIAASLVLLGVAALVDVDEGLPSWAIIIDLLVGGAFLIAGAATLASPGCRILVASTGALWLLGSIVPELSAGHRGVLAVCLLTFPFAVVGGPVRWTLLGMSLVVATGLVPLPIVAGLFAAIAVVRLTEDTTGAKGRRLEGPTVGAGASAMAVSVVLALSAGAEVSIPRIIESTDVLLLYESLLLAVAGTLVVSTRLRSFRTSELPDALLADGDAGLAGLASLLREVLRDPTLEILPPGAGLTPQESDPPLRETERRERIEVLDGNEPIAVLVHRTGSIPDERTARSIIEAVRLTAVHEKSTADLERRRNELAAAQTRMDQSADRRREELTARLRDGVLAPIDRARTAVEEARIAAVTAESRSALDIVAEELAGTEREVSEIVAGSLFGHNGTRLQDALRDLAARHPTVETSIDRDATGGPDAETTLRFVAFELVTNALKHASARRVLVRLSRSDDRLDLTVTDDGCGGADRLGSGLVGLERRLADHGGRLSITSPLGAGTTATASLPLSPPSSKAR